MFGEGMEVTFLQLVRIGVRVAVRVGVRIRIGVRFGLGLGLGSGSGLELVNGGEIPVS